MPLFFKHRIRYYISRRSLCDNCRIKDNCQEADSKHSCPYFQPIIIIFERCRKCNTMFEVHSTRRLRYSDECPDCQGVHE